jgi:hypothetical protein
MKALIRVSLLACLACNNGAAAPSAEERTRLVDQLATQMVADAQAADAEKRATAERSARFEEERARKLEAAKESAQRFAALMRQSGAWGKLIFDVAPNENSPNTLAIGVTSGWRILDKETRQKTAIVMQEAWAKVHAQNEPRAELCKVWLLDSTGRRVGGSSDWGSAVDVSVSGE